MNSSHDAVGGKFGFGLDIGEQRCQVTDLAVGHEHVRRQPGGLHAHRHQSPRRQRHQRSEAAAERATLVVDVRRQRRVQAQARAVVAADRHPQRGDRRHRLVMGIEVLQGVGGLAAEGRAASAARAMGDGCDGDAEPTSCADARRSFPAIAGRMVRDLAASAWAARGLASCRRRAWREAAGVVAAAHRSPHRCGDGCCVARRARRGCGRVHQPERGARGDRAAAVARAAWADMAGGRCGDGRGVAPRRG